MFERTRTHINTQSHTQTHSHSDTFTLRYTLSNAITQTYVRTLTITTHSLTYNNSTHLHQRVKITIFYDEWIVYAPVRKREIHNTIIVVYNTMFTHIVTKTVI